MLNFSFHNPTKIVFGTETIAQLSTLVPADARVLLLFGGNSARKNGTLDEVHAALGDRVVEEFGGIEANPTYETLMRAVDLVRQDKLDFLLAVGGGSVIDGTKFVAAAVPLCRRSLGNSADAWRQASTRALPLRQRIDLAGHRLGNEQRLGHHAARKPRPNLLS